MKKKKKPVKKKLTRASLKDFKFIRVTEETHRRLEERGTKHDTFETIIEKLLDTTEG